MTPSVVRNVYIVNSSWDFEKMWTSRGHNVVAALELADLVQFTGGADVSPELYGEANVASCCDANRDKNEQKIFSWCLENKKHMVGVCRGGQFLNVMNGGKMWQHVDNHAIGGTHGVWDYETATSRQCTSTHHQMMRPKFDSNCQLVGSSTKDRATTFRNAEAAFDESDLGCDVEVLYYPDTHCLCFQPHPEYGHKECEDYYFELIERFKL